MGMDWWMDAKSWVHISTGLLAFSVWLIAMFLRDKTKRWVRIAAVTGVAVLYAATVLFQIRLDQQVKAETVAEAEARRRETEKRLDNLQQLRLFIAEGENLLGSYRTQFLPDQVKRLERRMTDWARRTEKFLHGHNPALAQQFKNTSPPLDASLVGLSTRIETLKEMLNDFR